MELTGSARVRVAASAILILFASAIARGSPPEQAPATISFNEMGIRFPSSSTVVAIKTWWGAYIVYCDIGPTDQLLVYHNYVEFVAAYPSPGFFGMAAAATDTGVVFLGRNIFTNKTQLAVLDLGPNRKAPVFYGLVLAGTLGGTVLTLIHVDPVQLLVISAYINGLGAAKFCINRAVEYAKARKPFGKPLASNQAIQFPLVELHTQAAMLRALIRETAWSMDTYGPLTQADKVSMCNYVANRLCCEAADRAMQVHGGLGYSRHRPFEHIYRHHRRYRITEGAEEIQMRRVAGYLFGFIKPDTLKGVTG